VTAYDQAVMMGWETRRYLLIDVNGDSWERRWRGRGRPHPSELRPPPRSGHCRGRPRPPPPVVV